MLNDIVWNFQVKLIIDNIEKVDLEVIMLNKISQIERQILYNITCMWNL